jgi:hypothetical protein
MRDAIRGFGGFDEKLADPADVVALYVVGL